MELKDIGNTELIELKNLSINNNSLFLSANSTILQVAIKTEHFCISSISWKKKIK